MAVLSVKELEKKVRENLAKASIRVTMAPTKSKLEGLTLTKHNGRLYFVKG